MGRNLPRNGLSDAFARKWLKNALVLPVLFGTFQKKYRMEVVKTMT